MSRPISTLRQVSLGEFPQTPLYDLISQSTVSWDPIVNSVSRLILKGSDLLTLFDISGGITCILFVEQDNVGSRLLTYDSHFKWSGGTPPVLSTAAGAVDILSFVADDNYLYGVAQLNFS